jgi:NhaP-type Na+/H+ or K+/H+ antiporter
VFFAAVALRQTEMKLAGLAVPAAQAAAPLEGDAPVEPPPESPPTVSEGSLVFKEHLERLSELMLVLLLGGSLYLDSWSWPAVGLALFLFAVARPLSVFVGLLGTRTPRRMLGMTGWFGVRGIGSLYYLMYAIQHGLPEALALQLMQLTLIVVALSILLHGLSVKPMMSLVWRRGRA